LSNHLRLVLLLDLGVDATLAGRLVQLPLGHLESISVSVFVLRDGCEDFYEIFLPKIREKGW
jgi:hypothetical protein